jgi:3-oxoacyl-[acyl-carrier protein] reductase
VGDIGSPDGAATVVQTALERTGRIDVLVNNAGVAPGVVPLAETDDEAMDRVWRINLRGMMQCCRAALDVMESAKYGRIVNIGSRSWLGTPGHTAYAATKGGVVSFTRTLALELGPHGITANVVAPGSVVTPALERLGPAYLESIYRRHPAGRLGDPHDIGRAVRFLAHPASGAITGQVLHVCGGRSLHGGPWDARSERLSAADNAG